MNKKVLVSLVVALLVIGATSTSAQEVTEIRWGTSAVGSSGHRALTCSGESAERGDGRLPGHRAADARRDRVGQGLRHRRVRRLLRLRHRLLRARQRHQPLQGLQGEHRSASRSSPSGRSRSRWASASTPAQREKIEAVGGPLGQARVHGAAALGHPRPDRARARGARHQARVRAGRPEHRGLAARIAASIDGLRIYTNAEATTAPWIAETSLTTDWAVLNPSAEELDRLQEGRLRVHRGDEPRRGLQGGRSTPTRRSCCRSTTASTSASRCPRTTSTGCSRSSRRTPPSSPRPMPSFAQIAKDMAGIQVRGVESSVDLVPIHPGPRQVHAREGRLGREVGCPGREAIAAR